MVGGRHRREGVEQHRLVTRVSRIRDQRLGDRAADSLTLSRWNHIETLHLAHGVAKSSNATTSDEHHVASGQEETPVGWTVLLCQAVDLVLNILEAEVEIQARDVLLDKPAGCVPQFRRVRSNQFNGLGTDHFVRIVDLHGTFSIHFSNGLLL